MKFKANANPGPTRSKMDWSKVERIVVPDASISLHEILTRFTRGEALDVGFDGQFDENADINNPLSIDLEKLMKADITEQKQYWEQVKTVQDRYIAQEEIKKKASEAKRIAEQEELHRQKMENELRRKILAEQNSGKSAV